MYFRNSLIVISIFCVSVTAKDIWYDGNLKGIEEINLDVNLRGSNEAAWRSQITQYIQLYLLDNQLKTSIQIPMPKLVVDIYIIDSSVEPVSSFLINYSLYNYAVSEAVYYKSIVDTVITKKFMTNRIYSQELLGQSSSSKIYFDVENGIKKMASAFIDQWYRDNPLKQF